MQSLKLMKINTKQYKNAQTYTNFQVYVCASFLLTNSMKYDILYLQKGVVYHDNQ